MAGIQREFSLCETVASALHMVGEAYGIDRCWLPLHFERYILTGGTAPFRITTNDYPFNVKDGVDKVSFEIDFDKMSPNLIKYLRFDELPSKGRYIVTQTSMKHLQEGGANCALWIEIPKGADQEGISGTQALLKAKICCDEWKDHLPPSPETAIERAYLVISQDNTEWLKKQVVFKDMAISRLSSSLAFSRIEIGALTAEMAKLNIKVAKTESLQDKIDELKAEHKTELKAKDAIVEGLEAQVKSLNKKIQKLKGPLKTKVEPIRKHRADLRVKGDTIEDSDLDSPTPPSTKKRKLGHPKTPKGKGPRANKSPRSAPPQLGSPSTPYRPRVFQNVAFTLGDNVIAARTRGAMMASITPVADTPTTADAPTMANTPTAESRNNAPSVISISSGSGGDGGEVFN